MPFEKLFSRHRRRLRRTGLGTDLAYAVSSPLIGGIRLLVGVAQFDLAG